MYDPTSQTTKDPLHLIARILYDKRRHILDAKTNQYGFRRFSLSSPYGRCHTKVKTTTRKRTKRTFKRKTKKNDKTLKKTTQMTRRFKATKAMTKKPHFGVVYKRLTVIKDGKVMVKVIKGTATTIAKETIDRRIQLS